MISTADPATKIPADRSALRNAYAVYRFEEPRELTEIEIDEVCKAIVEHGVDGPEKLRILPVPGTVLVWYDSDD